MRQHKTMTKWELILKGVEICKKVAWPFAGLSKQKPWRLSSGRTKGYADGKVIGTGAAENLREDPDGIARLEALPRQSRNSPRPRLSISAFSICLLVYL